MSCNFIDAGVAWPLIMSDILLHMETANNFDCAANIWAAYIAAPTSTES